MRIVRVRIYALTLPLVRPVRTGHGVVARRSGHLLELSDADGGSGWGEALPLPSFGGEAAADCAAALQAAAPRLLGVSLEDEDAAAGLVASLASAPVALAAVEMARLDLLSQSQRQSAAACLGAVREVDSLPVNALLTADTAAELEREAGGAVAAGFETLKLKVAAGPLSADLERLRAVRRAAPAPLRLRLDANAGWTEDEAARALTLFSEFEPEWLEQPVAAGDPKVFLRLRQCAANAGIDLAADESAGSEAELRALLELGAVDAVVIKLPVLGGPWRAAAIAAAAQRDGVRVSVTSFLDSTLGIAAAAHLAASLPEPPAACGLATASLLARDVAPPWRVAGGRLWFPDASSPDAGGGLGARPRVATGGDPSCALELDLAL